MFRRPLSGALCAVLLLFTGPLSLARAHSDVDEGRRLAQEADFEGAAAAFDRAEASSSLTHEDLVFLLEGRALVHMALGQQPALERTLTALASVAPTHRMGRDLPPDLRAAFARALQASPGPLALETAASWRDDGLVLDARLLHDSGGLLRGVRVAWRADSGPWAVATAVPAVLGGPAARTVDYHVVAIGPGGAPLATRGSAREPLQETRPGAISDGARVPDPVVAARAATPVPTGSPVLAPVADEEPEDDSATPWPWIIGGAVVLAGIAVVVAILLIPGSDTRPSFPSFPLD